MKMTYRTRRRLRRLGVGTAYLLLAVLLVGVCWFVWLERFVVYDASGAHVVFDYVSPAGEAQIAQPPQQETVAIHYNEGEDYVQTSSELTQIRGYYATTSDLIDSSVDVVKTTITELPTDSAVMLEVKDAMGSFFYSSELADAPITDKIDVTQMDSLIKALTDTDRYVIARVPAFRDYAYGLNHTNYGLAHSSGAYLWADEDNCYWLNPASNGALSWLIAITNELRELGFDEVVFTNFQFPNTDSIIFDSSMSRQEALEAAAQTIVDACATSKFAVSFEASDPQFLLPEGRSRLYLTGVDAAEVVSAAQSTTVADTTVNLVFQTETNDTRFDAYGTMRPMPLPN